MIYKLGGRKYVLAVFLIVIFTVFGAYVVYAKADLSDAALYISAIGGTAGIYWHQNVKQKLNGKPSS